jgi:hypothetical protein
MRYTIPAVPCALDATLIFVLAFYMHWSLQYTVDLARQSLHSSLLPIFEILRL